jgi:hypothetical protein
MFSAMNKKIILALVLTTVTSFALAQLTNPWGIPIYQYALIVKRDGSTIRGKVVGYGRSRGGYFKFAIEDSTKQKQILFANAATYAIFWKTNSHPLPVVAEGIQNIKPADFKKYFGDDFQSYVRMGPLNNIYYFGELANISYCEKIKIYFAPLSYGTTTSFSNALFSFPSHYRWWNHNQYPFFVEKNGVTMKVRNGNYQKRFIELFHDCPELMKLPKRERKFAHFEEHVRIYDKTCG